MDTHFVDGCVEFSLVKERFSWQDALQPQTNQQYTQHFDTSAKSSSDVREKKDAMPFLR